MGIRFHCHHCHHELHVKDFQAGKRGRCPECQGKFRIPLSDAQFSIEVDQAASQLAVVGKSQTAKSSLRDQKPQHNDLQHSDARHSDVRPANTQRVEEKQMTATTTSESVPVANEAPQPTQLTKKKKKPAAISPQHAATDCAATSDAPVLPRAIADYPAGTWHVRPAAGGQYGPAPAETMGQWLIEGRVARDALVWRDDWAEWLSAEQAFDDYFQLEPTTNAKAAEVPASHVAAGAELTQQPPDAPATAQAILTTAGRSRLERKHKKRQRYIIIVSILTVLFIALLVALVAVLFLPNG